MNKNIFGVHFFFFKVIRVSAIKSLETTGLEALFDGR